MDAPRERLPGLDGIRGLTALFVVVHHTFLRSFPGYPVDSGPFWAGWLIYGHFGVVVFIVLSGFSLAVSPARHGWQLDGVGRFLQRRAWRILPPYWAALLFSLLVAWFVVPQPGQPVPDASSVLVNGLLLQDLFAAPIPNRAFWTIAIEAQLYLLFPLLLLVIRRANAVVMVAGVSAAAVAADVLAPHVSVVDRLVGITPQLAVLFALGVLAAGLYRRAWRWEWLALAAAVPVLATIAAAGSVWTLGHLFWIDLALGPAIACLLAAVATGRPAPLVRVLDTRALHGLGSSSYSLYLTHAPIVVVLYTEVVAGRFRQGVPSFLASVAIVVPVTIAFAQGFARVFEFPFQRHRGWRAPGQAARELWKPGSRPSVQQIRKM